MNRREFLKGTAWMGVTAAAAGCMNTRLFDFASGAPMMDFKCAPLKKIRVGCIGLGARGQGPLYRLPVIPGVVITALCDIVPEKIAAAQKRIGDLGNPKAKEYCGPEAYKAVCDDPEVDVVYQCTPWPLHTPIAIYAMKAGKHVMTEVPAAMTIDECWEQVETAEKMKVHCMQLENCCYGETELLALNMCRKGLLGELMHGEAAYIHDLSGHATRKVGDVEWWRDDWNQLHKGNQYPTHGLGPVCQYMGVNRGDQFDYLVSLENRQARMVLKSEKFKGRFQGQKFEMSDMNMTLIRTALGRSILLAHDVSSPRPYTRYNTIQGTLGILTDYPYRLALEKELGDGKAHEYMKEEEAEKYRKDYMHPLWGHVGALAEQIGGHGGMDFLMDLRWCYCMQNGLPLDMSVYDLAAWCSMCELTEKSVRGGSKPVRCIDFTRGAWKTTEPLGIVDVDMAKLPFRKNIGKDDKALNV